MLSIGARGGDRIAQFALNAIERAESHPTVLTFTDGVPTVGVRGETTASSGYRDMTINLDLIYGADWQRSTDGLVMLHEFGHAWAHNILGIPTQSYPSSLDFENAARRAVGYQQRTQHEGSWPIIRGIPQ